MACLLMCKTGREAARRAGRFLLCEGSFLNQHHRGSYDRFSWWIWIIKKRKRMRIWISGRICQRFSGSARSRALCTAETSIRPCGAGFRPSSSLGTGRAESRKVTPEARILAVEQVQSISKASLGLVSCCRVPESQRRSGCSYLKDCDEGGHFRGGASQGIAPAWMPGCRGKMRK